MARSTTLFLVRHGETDWNVAHRMQGHTDVPLNDRGVEQAAAAALGLAGQRFDAIYSSDLSRAYSTAAAIAAQLTDAPAIQKEPALRERHLGVLQGLDTREAAARHPDVWRRMHGNSAFVIPEGESIDQLAHRTTGRLEEIAEAHPKQRVLVVTHGGVLTCIAKHVLGVAQSTPRKFAITNAAISELSYGSGHGFFLQRWNDTTHLEALGFLHH